MKKIFLGIAFIANLASCSNNEPANEGGNVGEMGVYEVKISYKGISFDEEFPPIMNLTISGITEKNTPTKYYTKADDKVVELPSIGGTFTNNYKFSYKDTTITVFTDKNVNNLAVGKILIVNTSTGNYDITYNYEFKKNGKVLKEGGENVTINTYNGIEVDLIE